MKIGILTQPLQYNYGGLLQAFALSIQLKSLGHDPLIINRERSRPSWLRYKGYVLKNSILKNKSVLRLLLNKYQRSIITRETEAFKKEYLPNRTKLFTKDRDMYRLNKMGFDAYIVGSDQCWRPRYSPNIRNYFLDFASNQKDVKRIAYAASFGVEEWEFNEEDTRVCRDLLSSFDAIGVREDTGRGLVFRYLGRQDAVHLIDPTMLLTADQYRDIIDRENRVSSDGHLFLYLLDRNDHKDRLVQDMAKKTNLVSYDSMPRKRLGVDDVTNTNAAEFAFISPVQWLRGLQGAAFVITDSFHGTVFSILFNVPFITIGNEKRGMSRFTSLLKMFGLESRLLMNPSCNAIQNIDFDDIDWTEVNNILDRERSKAISFLKSNLN
ncbi:MAG: polysaccharide pyruvyl transferase family protein [Petrimonas sp.]|uniref:polysaccharide pyruvyl transferase family protein n=1 Tax=Dysgonomonadaceae TaxID=2005520 RepID=UPI002B2069AA|nr:polysaccharide pyruvyl transferase family protein [Proteiniphilum sp.]MEA5046222.1 polysaccharide pyruvyl transferase family protein [Petrimonas sp.]MEA5130182.1 polysaccharide pyruvyl transferase family protein [Proteiniphilum sp.]